MPDFTHVMLGGRIVETGGAELARELHTARLRPHPQRVSGGGGREREMLRRRQKQPRPLAIDARTRELSDHESEDDRTMCYRTTID